MNLSTLRAAVVAALWADAPLCALLAVHPDDATRPALFQGRQEDAPDVYPSLTYRLPEIIPDPRFRPTQAEGGGESPVWTATLEAEAWTRSGPDALDPITRRLVAVLSGKALPATQQGWVPALRVFDTETPLILSDNYDDKRKLHFALYRFTLKAHQSAP